MSRIRRKRGAQTPVRLPKDIAGAVSQLAGSTGWSANKALAFIASAGWNALNGAGDKIRAMQQVMTAAVAHYETQVATRKRLALTAGKLRVAQKALELPSPETKRP